MNAENALENLTPFVEYKKNVMNLQFWSLSSSVANSDNFLQAYSIKINKLSIFFQNIQNSAKYW